MGLERDGTFLKAVFPASSKGWSQQGSIVTPWRVAIIAEGLNALVNSDIVTNLCPPPSAELANADWIKPGRSLWQWWAIGAPRLDDQKEWVDAAKKLGFEYYLIDEGWRSWRAPGKDQWQCLKEVIDYAKTQGVASLVWVNSSEMRTDATRRAYLEKVAALGAVGIKIDFIPACTRRRSPAGTKVRSRTLPNCICCATSMARSNPPAAAAPGRTSSRAKPYAATNTT